MNKNYFTDLLKIADKIFNKTSADAIVDKLNYTDLIKLSNREKQYNELNVDVDKLDTASSNEFLELKRQLIKKVGDPIDSKVLKTALQESFFDKIDTSGMSVNQIDIIDKLSSEDKAGNLQVRALAEDFVNALEQGLNPTNIDVRSHSAQELIEHMSKRGISLNAFKSKAPDYEPTNEVIGHIVAYTASAVMIKKLRDQIKQYTKDKRDCEARSKNANDKKRMSFKTHRDLNDITDNYLSKTSKTSFNESSVIDLDLNQYRALTEKQKRCDSGVRLKGLVAIEKGFMDAKAKSLIENNRDISILAQEVAKAQVFDMKDDVAQVLVFNALYEVAQIEDISNLEVLKARNDELIGTILDIQANFKKLISNAATVDVHNNMKALDLLRIARRSNNTDKIIDALAAVISTFVGGSGVDLKGGYYER